MKVISYLKGIPPRNKNNEKEDVLRRFVEGVKKHGDEGHASIQTSWTPSDVAVIQGFVHANSGNSPHLMLRRSVIQNQKAHRKKTCIIDSNLFLYADPTNSQHYLRYSFDGVFPTTGNYFTDTVDPKRWKKISSNLGIYLKDWRKDGKHILICTQRNGGWSMGGVDVVTWVRNTISELRKHTDRPIVVRGHPGDKRSKVYLSNKGWKISNNENILQDFTKAHAVITYNSSPGVAAAIEGIPVFVTDPNPKVSQAYDVANTNLSLIETPNLPERQEWIEKLCMSHWNFSELSNGEAWEHIRNYV
jgi:hypothetical protein